MGVMWSIHIHSGRQHTSGRSIIVTELFQSLIKQCNFCCLLLKMFFLLTIETQTVEVEDQTSALLCLPGTHVMNSWNGVSNVVELLYHLADEGDVQTAVTMILALGERIIPLLNENAIEHWLDFERHFPQCFIFWYFFYWYVELSICSIPTLTIIRSGTRYFNDNKFQILGLFLL